ncbi:MAG: hypothetical protein JO185_03915 [Acidobacteriaceae bacterium]|nr:hypothetical protein [Acidobacteriaceae bacterium]
MVLETLPFDLVALAEAEFGRGGCAPHLLRVFLTPDAYVRDSALALLSSAKGLSGELWTGRCLALLLLENQLLRLTPDDLSEFDLILVALGLKPEIGHAIPVRASVLKEGFSTQNLRGFITELIRRLSRLNRVHEPIRRPDCDRVGWEYFFRTSRDVCKLTLARYVFSAEEVIQEIESSLVITKGAEDVIPHSESKAATRSSQPLDAPVFETQILQRLCADHRIYWVSERCGSELNSMVEYPLTSAVVVIKPPGSDIEIEIKRAGTHGMRLLNVIIQRNGTDAPTSHRLFGGSLGWLAEREAASARIFSKIFQLAHGKECPCSGSVLNSSIVTVPSAEGETHILDYFTDRQQFGPGFDDMRRAMSACVDSFPWDTGVARASYGGDLGLTLQFVGQALPQQAIILGSSSFRLDRLALYLSDDGPEEYFRSGLGRGYTLRDVRWLADSVLEEILGEITIPSEGYQDYAQYIRDAFRVPENRKRADENFLSAMSQIGECWGTLLAVRGFSDGESFVLRNVGLKSVWKNGVWQIRIIFMDHDDLTVAGSRYQYLWPWREVSGMQRDQVHILGGPMGDVMLPGEVGVLKNIYRVSSDVGDAGLQSLKEAMRAAYLGTQSQLANNQALRELFYPEFLEGYRDFDELVPNLLKTDPSQTESWKMEAEAYLKDKHYNNELIAEYTKTLSHFRGFFEQISFLYSK